MRFAVSMLLAVAVLALTATAVTAAEEETQNGVITAVNLESSFIKMTDKQGQNEKQYKVALLCKVYLDGKLSNLESLVEGYFAEVTLNRQGSLATIRASRTEPQLD